MNRRGQYSGREVPSFSGYDAHMDLSLLRLPSLLLLLAALFGLLLAFWQARACARRMRHRRPLAAAHRGIWSVVGLLLAFAFGGFGLTLLGYARLEAEQTIADLSVQQLGPQSFAVTLDRGNGEPQRFELSGDEWRLDARVVRWHPRLTMLGVPPLYRLDRLSGRYTEIDQELEGPRSAYALDRGAIPDLWALRRGHPEWLPFVDADQGSGVYLPLLDGANYRVSLDARGGLVARPADEATAALLQRSHW